MDEKTYQKALKLFRETAYGEAYNLLKQHEDDLSPKARQLMNESCNLNADKYYYIIKESIETGDVDRAFRIKAQYEARYGHNPKIDGIRMSENDLSYLYDDDESSVQEFFKSQAFIIGLVIFLIIVLLASC